MLDCDLEDHSFGWTVLLNWAAVLISPVLWLGLGVDSKLWHFVQKCICPSLVYICSNTLIVFLLQIMCRGWLGRKLVSISLKYFLPILVATFSEYSE